MSDLNLEIDSSDGDKSLRELSSAVHELKRALQSLGEAPVDQIRNQLKGLTGGVEMLAHALDGSLAQAQRTAADGGRKIGEGFRQALEFEGVKAVATVKEMRQRLQREYESSLGRGAVFKVQALLDLQTQGVTIAPADKLRLQASKLLGQSATKLSLDDTRNLLGMPSRDEMKTFAGQLQAQMREDLSSQALRVKSAAKFSLDDTRSLLGMPSRDEMKAFTAQLKAQMQEDLSNQALRVKSATAMSIDDTRGLLGMPSRDEMKSFTASIKAQMQDDLAAQALRARAASKYSLDDTRSLLGMPSRDDMKSFAAQLKSQMQEDLTNQALRVKSASKFSVDDTRSLLGMPSRDEMKSFSVQLKAQLEQEALSAANAARAAVRLATRQAAGAYSEISTGKLVSPVDVLDARKVNEVQSAVKSLTGSMGELHSASRGVASGFNAMWLTWGSIAPLLAGAALSNAFVQSIRKGSEFTQTLTAIGALSEKSSEEVGLLGTKALELGSKGPHGPLELAAAFKTLSLAGLNTREQLEAIGTVRNFAIVGETDMKASAEGLIAIATAYGYAAKDYEVVGDIVAKTAASSMASVSDMTEAFKTASVVAQQYGVSLKDTSTTLALLSQIGITGTAAGTAMRNMYTELMGSSKKARDVLKETLKVDVWDNAAKAMKPLPAIMKELSESIGKLDSRGQQDVMAALGNERGMKAMVANLIALQTEFDKTGKSGTSAFQHIQDEIEQAPGYMAQAAAVMEQSTANQIKSVGAALETSLVKSFQKIEPSVQSLALRLRELFGSPEFQNAISSMAGSLATFTEFLVNHADGIATVAKGYLVYKGAVIAAQLATAATELVVAGASGAWSGLSKTLWGATAVLSQVVRLNFSGAAASLTSLLGVAGGAAGVMATLGAALGWVTAAIAAVSLAWTFFSDSAKEASDTNAKSVANLNAGLGSLMGSIDEEIKRLDAVDAARAKGLAGAMASAAVESTLAKGKIQDIYEQKQSLLDLEEQELKTALAAKAKYVDLPVVGSLARNAQVEIMTQLLDLSQRRNALYSEEASKLARVDELQRKAAASAVAAAKEAAEGFKNRTSGTGTFNPDKGSDREHERLLASRREAERAMTEYTKAAAELRLQNRRDEIGRELELNQYLYTTDQSAYSQYLREKERLTEAAAHEEIKVKSDLAADLRQQLDSKREDLMNKPGKNEIERNKQVADYLSLLKEVTKAEADAGKASADAITARLKRQAEVYQSVHDTVQRARDEQADSLLGGSSKAMALASEESNMRARIAIYAEGTRERIALEKQVNDYVEITQQKLANDALKDWVDTLDGSMKSAGEGMLSLVKGVEALALVERKRADQANEFARQKEAAKDNPRELAQIAKQEQANIKITETAQLRAYANMISGAKGFFKEHTAGYKALDMVEKGFRAAELARAAVTLAEKLGLIGVETAAVVGSETMKQGAENTTTLLSLGKTAARTAAKSVEALVTQLTLPFPANVPALAATAAMLAALGVATGAFGGGGGGSFESTNDGTGTVLGDSGAKSESISKSLELLDSLNTLTGVQLSYTRQMAASLRTIESSLGGVSSLLLRNGTTTSMSGLVNTGFERNGFGNVAAAPYEAAASIDKYIPVVGDMLSGLNQALGNFVGNLFGTKTSIEGQGLAAGGQSYGAVLANGLNLQTYADVEEKHKTLGVTTGTDRYTIYRQANAETTSQFTKILTSLGDTVASAAAPLLGSLQNAKDKLSTYVVSLGRIDVQGLSGKDLQERLSAVFSAEGDKMAKAIMPGLEAMQAVGEGYMETLVRVSSVLGTVNDAMSTLGQRMFDSSIAGAKLSISLVNAFGGIDKYSSSLQKYYETYYSEGERNANTLAKVTNALHELGFSTVPTTLEQYRKMVDDYVAGGALLNESGQAVYAQLISLSEPFATVAQSATDMKNALISASTDVLDYVNKLKGERAGLGTPQQALSAARDTYLTDLTSAKNGDSDAMGRLTSSADAYIAAQRAVTASSDYTQAVIDQVIAELTKVGNAGKTGVPAFAAGGYHAGGWALVGEKGPEYAYFNAPARIYNAQDTSAMRDNSAVVAELQALRAEVSALRDQQGNETRAIVESNWAGQQQAAETVVAGVADASDRQSWAQQTQPVIK